MKRFWLAIGTLVQLTVVAVAVGALFWSGTVNGWLSAGLAIFFVIPAFRSLAFGQFKQCHRPEIAAHVMLIAMVLAAVLCGIGSVVIGGALGWLGVFICLRTGLWPVRVLYRWSVSREQPAGFNYERESEWLFSLYVVFPLVVFVLGLVFIGLWRR